MSRGCRSIKSSPLNWGGDWHVAASKVSPGVLRYDHMISQHRALSHSRGLPFSFNSLKLSISNKSGNVRSAFSLISKVLIFVIFSKLSCDKNVSLLRLMKMFCIVGMYRFIAGNLSNEHPSIVRLFTLVGRYCNTLNPSAPISISRRASHLIFRSGLRSKFVIFSVMLFDNVIIFRFLVIGPSDSGKW